MFYVLWIQKIISASNRQKCSVRHIKKKKKIDTWSLNRFSFLNSSQKAKKNFTLQTSIMVLVTVAAARSV